MFTISNITWTVKQIVSMVEGNKKSVMCFDDEIQRDTVWKKEQKSLFIDSILRGYPIPPLYAEKYDNEEKRIYNVLDGKQRCTTLYNFVKGSFELSDDLDNIENDFGEDVDVSGCKFNELPEDLQDKILDKTLTVYYCEGMTEDEKSEMFYRLNNGKPLSSIEITRCKAKSLSRVSKIATTHELFTNNFTVKQIKHYATEDIVFKTWIMLNNPLEEISMENKYVRPIMQSVELTDDDVENLNKVFDYINEVEKGLSKDKKVAKKLVTRMHLLSVVPVVKMAIDNGMEVDAFTDWVRNFFTNTPEEYAKAAKDGVNHKENVKIRTQTMIDNIKKWDQRWLKYSFAI